MRCKEFRDRRKSKKQKLEAENAKFRKEREDLLQTIVRLELSLDKIHGEAYVDFTQENAFLREELKIYSDMVSNILSIARQPLKTHILSKHRGIVSTAEQAIAQIFGLVKSSSNAVSSSSRWNQVSADKFNGFLKEMKLRSVTAQYQYLPMGSEVQDARRLNTRFDLGYIPVPVQSAAEDMWRSVVDLGAQRRHIHTIAKFKSFRLNEASIYSLKMGK